MSTQNDNKEADLLPHFTLQLELELQRRLKRRLLDEGHISATPSYSVALECHVFPFIDEQEADKLASVVVRRMYRFRWNEAKQVLSFSNAVLKFNKPENKATLDSLVENARRAATAPLSVPASAAGLSIPR